MALLTRMVFKDNNKENDYSQIPLAKEINHRKYAVKTIDNVMLRVSIFSPKNIRSNPTHAILFRPNRLGKVLFLSFFEIFKMVIQYNLILMMPDYRGFGESKGKFDFSKVANDIDVSFEFFRRIYKNFPIYFIAYSMGGTIALEYVSFVSEKEKKIARNNPATLDISSIYMELKKIDKDQCTVQMKDGCFSADRLYLNRPDKTVLVAPFISCTDSLCASDYWIVNKLFYLPALLFDMLMNINPLRDVDFLTEQNTILVYSDFDEVIPLKSAERLSKYAKKAFIRGMSHNKLFENINWPQFMYFICKKRSENDE